MGSGPPGRPDPMLEMAGMAMPILVVVLGAAAAVAIVVVVVVVALTIRNRSSMNSRSSNNHRMRSIIGVWTPKGSEPHVRKLLTWGLDLLGVETPC